jgi:hypothetical protein
MFKSCAKEIYHMNIQQRKECKGTKIQCLILLVCFIKISIILFGNNGLRLSLLESDFTIMSRLKPKPEKKA